jgi:multiple sugar transport system permease protein
MLIRPRQICLLVVATAITVVMLFPIYWMVVTAILPTSEVLSRHPPLLPPLSEISFASFIAVWERRPILQWMLNSSIVSLGATALSLVVATTGGYSLSRYRNRGQQAAGALLLMSKLLPPSLIIIPIFIMFNLLHLMNSYVGLILANVAVGIPFATWMMKGFFDGIPRELEYAAMIDGCSELQAMWHIILPLARPGLAACAIYLIILGWSEFVFARTLMTSADHTLLTVGLQKFIGEYVVDWGDLMAAGTVSLLPMVILFIILEPFLVSGLTKGAVAN